MPNNIYDKPIDLKDYNDMSFKDTNNPKSIRKRPLMLSSSGGGGHIQAINSIYNYLHANQETLIHNKQVYLEIPKHKPLAYAEKDKSHAQVTQIHTASEYFHGIGGSVIQNAASYTLGIEIPPKDILNLGINALNQKHTQAHENIYLDVLLDIYPAGYESAALWNYLQSQTAMRICKKPRFKHQGNQLAFFNNKNKRKQIQIIAIFSFIKQR